MKTQHTLIGHEIEGQWNVPLLANAAEMSDASLLFVENKLPPGATPETSGSNTGIDEVIGSFDRVLACETGRKSRPVFECPMPRGNIAFIVGNERTGLPATLLKKADDIIAIPMHGKCLSSVNVAVAAAIILYAAERDIGRKRSRTVPLSHRDVDVLVFGPSDPSELGSFFRSAWAFGWRRIFLEDTAAAWLTDDRKKILAGRAAARGEVNRLVVCPAEQINFDEYDHLVVCGQERSGDPLSRFTLPSQGKLLLVFGAVDESLTSHDSVQQVYVDHANPAAEPCFRHAGSILLSVVSQQLAKVRRG